MSETAGSMFAKIITDQLKGREVSEEREQEFVDQAARQTGGRVTMGEISSHEVTEDNKPFTHCDFCDAPIKKESHALEDGGHYFCDDDCMDEFNN